MVGLVSRPDFNEQEVWLLRRESGKHDEVTDTEREILINALELNDISVKDVMTPRSEVVFLDVDANFEKNSKEITKKFKNFVIEHQNNAKFNLGSARLRLDKSWKVPHQF